MERLEATVHGLVQGVSFRYYTVRAARNLGLTGWCANQPNGSVRVVAEGPRPALETLLRWLHKGSPAARVRAVDADWLPAGGGFTSFDVRSG